MSHVVVAHRFRCACSPESLWPIVGDTNQLNELAGMVPRVAFRERPARWSYPDWFTLHREMASGPLRDVTMTIELEAVEGGSEVTITLTMEPITELLAPVVRFVASRQLQRLEGAVRALRRIHLGEQAPLGRTLAEQLNSWLARSTVVQASRIRPFALADDWGVDRRALLRQCLTAVGEGRLELRWELVCPSCRVGASTVNDLSELSGSGRCQRCDLDFELSLDRAIEAVFHRGGCDPRVYCMSGPAMTPHVLTQEVLPPEGSVTLTAPESPGRYRIFVRGGAAAQVIVRSGGLASASLRAVGGGLASPAPVAPGAQLTIRSGFDDERRLTLERPPWREAAATAYDVSLEPEFRRLSSIDALAPNTQLPVGQVSLMFTDLTGSTQLCDQLGDTAAYRLVRSHFGLLEAAIEAEGGAVVKTIGDAMMAAFPDPSSALAAATACQEAWPDFLASLGHHPRRTLLRIGVHTGPCYAVRANGVLDYFGSAVNVAARVEACARGGEIAMTAELLAGVTLPEGLSVRDRRKVRLKGITSQVELVWLSAAPAATERRLAA